MLERASTGYVMFCIHKTSNRRGRVILAGAGCGIQMHKRVVSQQFDSACRSRVSFFLTRQGLSDDGFE